MLGKHVAPAWTRALTLALALSAAATAFAGPAHGATVVSLTFDDGEASQYPVKDLLASRGMHGTFFVNSAKVGTGSFYMTWAQVDALKAAGNEIAGHTLTHADLNDTSLTEAQKRAEVCNDRQNLIARGYDPVSFAYPNGWGDALAESIVRDCGYQTGRRVGGIVSPNWCPSCGSPRAETVPPEDPFLVRTPAFGSGEITLAAMQNVIMQAEFGGGWVPLVFHGVCESACGGGWVKPGTLTALMDWLAPRGAQGTVVRTMREALTPPPPPADLDTSIDSKPPGRTIEKNAAFTFSSNRAGVTFECSLDGAAFASCTSPATYSNLSLGDHTFRARARDASGTVDATPATWTWTVNPPAAPTVVSLTFDDGQATQYSARQVLKDHGMHGTFYVNSGSVCTANCTGAFNMTWQQIADLAADGNEIGGHTLDHVDLTSTGVTAAEKRRQVCEDRQNLISRGFDPVSFAYPYARHDAAARAIVSECGYSSGRGAGGSPAGGETIPPLDPFGTRTADFSAGEITLGEMQDVITQAENAGGGWVQLTFHGICATACNEGWVKPGTFSALLDWLQPRESATGTVVRTVGAVVEGAGPETTLGSKPPALTNSRAASFSLSSDAAGATFECSLDGAAFTSCTTPAAYSGLGDGPHTFRARARNTAGVADPSPALWTWTVDGSAPDTTITDGPSGTVTSAGASFTFGSTESGSFECSLDGGAWAACASPKLYSGLANGSHTFSVRAIDGAGNTDVSPASRTWTVDAAGPGPAPRTVVSLTFDDGLATQPLARSILASHGVHGTFYVHSSKIGTSDYYMTWADVNGLATDGNEIGGHALTSVDLTDSSIPEAERRRQVCEDRQNLISRGFNPVSFAYPYGAVDSFAQTAVRDCGYTSGRRVGGIVSPNWCPDCTSPWAESIPPAEPFATRTPAFGSGEITLAAMQSVITQAEVDGGWVPLVFHGICNTACDEGWVKPTTLSALLDWLATRSVNGTGVRMVREVVSPSTEPPPPPPAPDTSITSGPSGTVASSAASFDFSSTPAGASFECKLDGGAYEACTAPKSYSGLSAGSHTFSVRANDGAGNVDPTPATRTWTVDTSAPETSITSGPSGTVNSASASFGFSATQAGSSFECKLDAGAWAACTSPKAYSGLTNGSHTFSVRAKDAAGNIDATPATRTWTVDRVAPNTSITSGPTGTVSSTTATFAFTSTEAGSSFECRLDGGAWGACTSPKTYSNLSRGSHTFYVRARDAAGNVDGSPATRSWKRR